MSINITHTLTNFQFENKENLKNAARNILNRQGSSSESSEKLIRQTIFSDSELYQNPHLSIIKASSQITLNNTLKETLKYLKSHSNQKNTKHPVLGEIWDVFNTDAEKFYDGELINLEIDYSSDNIFKAA